MAANMFEGNVSAKVSQFNAEKAAALLKEVEAEDKVFAEAERKKAAVAKKKEQELEERSRRRANLLALGMSEAELLELGLGEFEVDDDPSVCMVIYQQWRRSTARKGCVFLWMKLPCNRIRKAPPAPPADDRYIKSGATRHKCGHVCLMWQQQKCCWCSDRRNVPLTLSERAAEKKKEEEKKEEEKKKEEATRIKLMKKKARRSAWQRKQDEKKNKTVEIGSSVQFKSRYVVVVDQQEEDREKEEVDQVPETINELDVTPNDQVYSGWSEIDDTTCWVKQEDVHTRDAFYCHVCQKLGQGGKNLKGLVAEQNAKDEVLAKEMEEQAEEQRVLDEEANKMQEMAAMIDAENRRKAEQAMLAATTSSCGGGSSKGAEVAEEKEEVIKVDLNDAANTHARQIIVQR